VILAGKVDLIRQCAPVAARQQAFGIGLLTPLNPHFFWLSGRCAEGRYTRASCPILPPHLVAAQPGPAACRTINKIITLLRRPPLWSAGGLPGTGARKCDVGTPGRIKDHLDRGTLKLKRAHLSPGSRRG